MRIITAEAREVVRDQQGFVRGLALRLCPIRGAAEDVAQEVFLEFVEKFERWDLSRDPRPLLASITRNVAKRYWRLRSRQLSEGTRELADRIRSRWQEVEVSWYGVDEKEALRKCLERLPDRGRRMIHARYFLGLSAAEIGLQLRMRAVAVRNAMFRVRARLRSCVERVLGGEA